MKISKPQYHRLAVMLWIGMGAYLFNADPSTLKYGESVTKVVWGFSILILFGLAKLYPECKSCQALNAPGSKHCSNCGHDLK